MDRTDRSSFVRTLPFIIIVACAASLACGCKPPATAQTGVTADKDHGIDLATAARYTGSFRDSTDSTALRAEAFGKNAIVKLLDQAGCVGMRIYYGKDDDGRRVLVLVGVDVEGKDMYLGELDERGFPCPPICDDLSPLNGR